MSDTEKEAVINKSFRLPESIVEKIIVMAGKATAEKKAFVSETEIVIELLTKALSI